MNRKAKLAAGNNLGLGLVVNQLFGPRLLITNMVGGACLAYLGDYLRQRMKPSVKSGVEQVDHTLSKNMAIVSVPLSIEMHYWYKFLDRRFPGALTVNILKKVALDELIFAPNYTFTTIAGVSLLEKKSWSEIKQRLKTSFIPLYLVDVCFFTPVQFCNFYFFPTKYRVIVMYSASVIYFYLASYFIHEYH